MRPALWTIALLSTCAAAQFGWADTLDAPSTIESVIVYPDRATITRRLRVELPAGAHSVTVSGLPSAIDESSVTAKGVGTAPVTLIGARLITRQLERPHEPRVDELQQQLKELRRREGALRDTRTILERQRKYLASIQAASVQQAGKDLITRQPSADDVAALYAFIGGALATNAQELQANDVALEEVREVASRIERELAQLGGGTKSVTAIAVDVEAARAGTVELEVSYQLPGASWTPIYEARATSDATTVQLNTLASVRQQTGEDWSDVRLTLSTARPSIAGRMPELDAWFVSQQPAMVPMAERKMQWSANARLGGAVAGGFISGGSMAAADSVSLDVPVEVARATIETHGPAVQLVVTRRAAIPADGQPQLLPVAQAALPATFGYQATPKLSPYAYLHAQVTNASPVHLLPGEVRVFLDNAFVASSAVEGVAPGATFDLYLGVDERITVERTQLAEKVDVSVLPGVHGKSRTVDYAYLTTVKNHTGRAVTVELIDQLPVSQHDEIKIEQVASTPEPVTHPDDAAKPGVRRWTLAMTDGQQTDVRLGFRVRHPVAMAVNGL